MSFPARRVKGRGTEMAPSPNEATRSVEDEAGGGRQARPEVADASHVPPAASTKLPSLLPPIATLVSDPRTALSAKGRQRRRRSDESCQTATKSCDSRQVDILYLSLLSPTVPKIDNNLCSSSPSILAGNVTSWNMICVAGGF